MKSYVYAILFLVYGLAHFATQVQDTNLGNCQWGPAFVPLGSYTISHCRHLICHLGGIKTITECPRLSCPSGELLIGHKIRDIRRKYPDCCEQPICIPYHEYSPLAPQYLDIQLVKRD